jgi:hypothetical protein
MTGAPFDEFNSGEVFAPRFGATLTAAAAPRSLAKNCFRDGSWLTWQLSGWKIGSKEGCGVSLVNQNFGMIFFCSQN